MQTINGVVRISPSTAVWLLAVLGRPKPGFAVPDLDLLVQAEPISSFSIVFNRSKVWLPSAGISSGQAGKYSLAANCGQALEEKQLQNSKQRVLAMSKH